MAQFEHSLKLSRIMQNIKTKGSPIMKNKFFCALAFSASLTILFSGCSYIKIVDPSAEEQSLTTPHDLIVAHRGCGHAEGDSLRAYLDKDKPCESEIADAFEYDSQREKWIAAQYDLPPGRHTFTASADVSTAAWCINFQRRDSRDLTVTADPNWLPRVKNFHIDTIFHHEDFGYGEVLLPIDNLNFSVPVPAGVIINFNLTTDPPGLPICYYLSPDPTPSNCPPKQIKYGEYCYPMACINMSEEYHNTFTGELLGDNGTCWALDLGMYSTNAVPFGDYHVRGTISISFEH